MGIEIRERYIDPYTDFGFKKLFDQAEIAQFSPAERREYAESVKEILGLLQHHEDCSQEWKSRGSCRG
jgi:hypothetical protein